MNRTLKKVWGGKTARLAGVLLSLTLAAFFPGIPALALPQMPQQFYGSVTINGIAAPTGTIISARIGGIEYAATATDARGRYGYGPVFFMVPADATETTPKEGASPGDIVQLCVTGVSAGMIAFNSGQVVNMNLAVTLSAPSVTSRAATSVAATSATLNGELTSRGTPPTANVSFDYGTTTDYGNTTPSRTMTYTGRFSASVDLTPGVLYHFRARADGGIHGSSAGADLTFTTLPLPGGTPPVTPAPAPMPTSALIPTPAPTPLPSPSPAPSATPAPTADIVPSLVLSPLAPTITPASEPVPTFTPSPAFEPAPTPKPSPAAKPAPETKPPTSPAPGKMTPPQTIAPSLPWGFISKITALVVTVLIVAFVVVRKRRTLPKGKSKAAVPRSTRPLHQEADRLRKEVSLKCQEAIAGKDATPGLSQDYLLRKWYFLVETAYLLDIHSRWMQSKAGQIDNAEVRHYQELIDSLRKMMPPEPQI